MCTLLFGCLIEPFEQEDSGWNFGLIKTKFIWSILIYVEGFHASWTFLVLQQQQNLGRRFGTSKVHLRLPVA